VIQGKPMVDFHSIGVHVVCFKVMASGRDWAHAPWRCLIGGHGMGEGGRKWGWGRGGKMMR
jgi:hypothetical protein